MTALKPPAVERLLDEACARNLPAELHAVRRDGTITVQRVRLLEVREDQLLVQSPPGLCRDEAFAMGKSVTAHMTLNGSRYEFTSTIEDMALTVPLNARQHVRGMALSKPEQLLPSQRRSDLRVKTVSYEQIDVSLGYVAADAQDACSLAEGAGRGSLADISVGGAAILVCDPAFRTVRTNRQLFLVFELPLVDREFLMLGTIRHWRFIERSQTTRLAVAFSPWSGCRFASDQRDLARFVAAHERRFLRKRW